MKKWKNPKIFIIDPFYSEQENKAENKPLINTKENININKSEEINKLEKNVININKNLKQDNKDFQKINLNIINNQNEIDNDNKGKNIEDPHDIINPGNQEKEEINKFKEKIKI